MTQQQQGQGAAPGSKTFVHGTVTSVQFNFDTPKKAGGTYPACVLNYMDTQGQAKAEKWHMNIIDNPNNVELRNQLVQLYSAAGTQITIHKTKSQSGFWNVDRIDYGHVQGERTTQKSAPQQPPPGPAPVPGAPPQGGYPAPQPQAQPQPWNDNNDKRRSKEDCMRGEAVQAAALLELAAVQSGKEGPKTSRMFKNADHIVKYIQGGIQEPVAPADNTAPGASTAPPQPAPAPAAAQAPPSPPAPQAPAQAPQQPQAAPPPPPAPPAPAAAPPAAPAASAAPPPPGPAPVAPSEAPAQPQAQPQDFDDGFGGS